MKNEMKKETILELLMLLNENKAAARSGEARNWSKLAKQKAAEVRAELQRRGVKTDQ
jgi:hypothetical protein